MPYTHSNILCGWMNAMSMFVFLHMSELIANGVTNGSGRRLLMVQLG